MHQTLETAIQQSARLQGSGLTGPQGKRCLRLYRLCVDSGGCRLPVEQGILFQQLYPERTFQLNSEFQLEPRIQTCRRSRRGQLGQSWLVTECTLTAPAQPRSCAATRPTAHWPLHPTRQHRSARPQSTPAPPTHARAAWPRNPCRSAARPSDLSAPLAPLRSLSSRVNIHLTAPCRRRPTPGMAQRQPARNRFGAGVGRVRRNEGCASERSL
jgi:hypothetical protein